MARRRQVRLVTAATGHADRCHDLVVDAIVRLTVRPFPDFFILMAMLTTKPTSTPSTRPMTSTPSGDIAIMSLFLCVPCADCTGAFHAALWVQPPKSPAPRALVGSVFSSATGPCSCPVNEAVGAKRSVGVNRPVAEVVGRAPTRAIAAHCDVVEGAANCVGAGARSTGEQIQSERHVRGHRFGATPCVVARPAALRLECVGGASAISEIGPSAQRALGREGRGRRSDYRRRVIHGSAVLPD